MSERGISETRILDTIRRYERRSTVRDGALAFEKVFGTRRLRVICRERKKQEYVIITAYYL